MALGKEKMNTVKVNREELLTTVKANFDKHKEIVTEAFAKYRELAVAELDAMIAEAKAGKRIRRQVSLVEPIDQSAEYLTAIRKLEMSVDPVIEIDDEDFRHLVMDEWRWKGQFMASNRTYTTKADQ
jgi:hypothetical protein